MIVQGRGPFLEGEEAEDVATAEKAEAGEEAEESDGGASPSFTITPLTIRVGIAVDPARGWQRPGPLNAEAALSLGYFVRC